MTMEKSDNHNKKPDPEIVTGNAKHLLNSLKNTVTINDLKEKEYAGEDLTPRERTAIINYDRYRLRILKNTSNESDFHKKYLYLQILANTKPYEEFLKPEYYQ